MYRLGRIATPLLPRCDCAWQRFTSLPSNPYSSSEPSSSSQASSSAQGNQHDVQVVVMPKLSHSMQEAKLVRWLKRPGDAVDMYDVLMEVETEQLVEPVFKVGDFAGTVTLLVESQEEGYLAEVLVKEGPASIKAGTPVATFVEREESVQALKAAGGYQCPTTNVYDDAQPSVQVLPWQSFLKSAKRTVKCMG